LTGNIKENIPKKSSPFLQGRLWPNAVCNLLVCGLSHSLPKQQYFS